MMKVSAIAIYVLLRLCSLYSCDNSSGNTPEEKNEKEKIQAVKKRKGKKGEKAGENVVILKSWKMPRQLKEISGIALYDEKRFACVQDEDGIIFLFNIESDRIEKEVHFAGSGDYEGIVLIGSTAWVLRSDGLLFEVQDFNRSKPSVTEHRTPFTGAQDFEGITSDLKNKRLLISVKGKDPNSKAFKGVYAFDLTSKTASTTPVYKITSAKSSRSKKGRSRIKPSEIVLHPITRELYVLDGPGSRLLIIGKDGAEKAVYPLRRKDFPQPEGMAITKEGDLYISNEGKRKNGTILKVSVSE